MLTVSPDREENPAAPAPFDILQAGLDSHRAGDFAFAETCYRRTLESQPRNAFVLNLLGAIGIQTGRLEMAVDFLSAAVSVDSTVSDYHNNLAEAHRGLGRFDTAIAHYRLALDLAPEDAEARVNLGNALHQAGQIDAAIEEFHRVIAMRPDFPEAHNNLGNCLRSAGRLDEAARALTAALALRPDYAEAHQNLAIIRVDQGRTAEAAVSARQVLALAPEHAPAHNLLAEALLAEKDIAGAEASARHAVALAPDYAEAYATLGRVCSAQGKWAEAVPCFARAATLKPALTVPHVELGRALLELGRAQDAVTTLQAALGLHQDLAELHYYLGNAYFRLGDRERAIERFRRAAALKPSLAEAHFNLGGVLRELDRFDEAIESLGRAIAASSDYVEARNNLAYTLLRAGQLKKGFEAYEWRRHMPTLKRIRPFMQPIWDGAPLAGRTILIWGEQGIGDEILFANMLPDLVAQAKKVVVECDWRLVPMFQRSFPTAEIVARSEPPAARLMAADIDLQSSMGSLARYLRQSLDAFPKQQGYLKVDPERRRYWREKLDALGPGLKVGICWRSKLITDQRRPWLMHLGQLEPILKLPGIVLVNLQYDRCTQEIEDAKRLFGVTIHQMPGIDLMEEVDDAAALSAAMDVIISAWVSVATMSGALGLPAWTFGLNDEWSMLGTDHCPFQPSLRLFCRRPWEPWDGVVEQMRRELAARAAKPA